jgi:uncharacterized membrane protein
MEIIKKVSYSLLAGCFAALASVFGKLAVNPSALLQFTSLDEERFGIFQENMVSLFLLHSMLNCDFLGIIVRIACIACIVISNALMWLFFVKSMTLSNSLIATVWNNSSNLFFTVNPFSSHSFFSFLSFLVELFVKAVFGYLFFREPLTLQWSLGVLCIVIGLYFITTSSEDQKEKTQ